jgi:hypothetical protein
VEFPTRYSAMVFRNVHLKMMNQHAAGYWQPVVYASTVIVINGEELCEALLTFPFLSEELVVHQISSLLLRHIKIIN